MAVILDARIPVVLRPVDQSSLESLESLRQRYGKNDRELVELALYLLETVKRFNDEGLNIYAAKE